MRELTLSETWKLCLSMWRWIAKQVRAGRTDVTSLKNEWIEKKGFGSEKILHHCFFCHYTAEDFEFSEDCNQCPARKIDPYFDCCGGKYYYRPHPIAFYNKLVSLNRKRLKKNK